MNWLKIEIGTSRSYTTWQCNWFPWVPSVLTLIWMSPAVRPKRQRVPAYLGLVQKLLNGHEISRASCAPPSWAQCRLLLRRAANDLDVAPGQPGSVFFRNP